MVEDIDGVVKLAVPVPPASMLPPDDAAYQSIVKPAPGSATDKPTVPVPHLEPLTGLVGAAGNGLKVTVVLPSVPQPHPLLALK